jgi:2-polyprenyl-6-methoxyphenol hydroxylase-like FAD-dependent oxidoreductase
LENLASSDTIQARLEMLMNVLISGAAPAGLPAAYWLRRYGFRPTIVERAPSLQIGDYKIDVRGSALQVLERMGVHDAVVAAHTDMQGAQLVDQQGNIVKRMSGDDFGHRVGGGLPCTPLCVRHNWDACTFFMIRDKLTTSALL